jgi:hypothetical protein
VIDPKLITYAPDTLILLQVIICEVEESYFGLRVGIGIALCGLATFLSLTRLDCKNPQVSLGEILALEILKVHGCR